ncbi:MAG: serine/threonine-protein kinase [Candidatus Acidiferrales bacterium]
MIEPTVPKPSTESGNAAQSSGRRDTLLLSDVPDAVAVVAEPRASATGSASASTSLSPAALAALGQRYEILGEAGHGSMGNVYKARDRETGETVALKLLKPEIASDQAMMDRFKNELLFARKITHKNVCRVHEFNRVGGIAYTSMEFVEGESLRSVLNRFGGLPLRKATDLALQICSGLKEAHAQGIVHRDLKPENVMIDAQGNVKIMDFGIARSMEAGTRLTGSMVGTPAYMAPEQVAGKPVDYRTDIYSLGLMLYEMFTGVPAFSADNSIAVALKQMREEAPAPHEIDPGIPVATERAILKCMEKEPAKRFPSIADLETSLRDGAVPAPAARPAAASTNSNRVSTGSPRAAVVPAAIPQVAHARTSPFVWILLGVFLTAGLAVAALGGLYSLGVAKAARQITPPATPAPPKPPDFAYEIPAPAPATPEKAASKPAAPAPAKNPLAATSTASATPDVFPRMETGPLRKRFQPRSGDVAREPGSTSVVTNSMYLLVGSLQAGEKARATAKRIENMGLPTGLKASPFGANERFWVYCGPIDAKDVGSVTERLEAKGFLNVRAYRTPAGVPRQR